MNGPRRQKKPVGRLKGTNNTEGDRIYLVKNGGKGRGRNQHSKSSWWTEEQRASWEKPESGHKKRELGFRVRSKN